MVPTILWPAHYIKNESGYKFHLRSEHSHVYTACARAVMMIIIIGRGGGVWNTTKIEINL